MILKKAHIGGTVTYGNECTKSGVYSFDINNMPLGNGILVARPQPASSGYEMEVAQAGLWADGVTAPGSLKTESGIFKVAYPSNSDGFLVRTADTVIAYGVNLYVGANGFATAVVPTTDHYVIGTAISGVVEDVDCEGNPVSFVNALIFSSRDFVSVAAPLRSESYKKVIAKTEEVK